jgi:hypothetical protein
MAFSGLEDVRAFCLAFAVEPLRGDPVDFEVFRVAGLLAGLVGLLPLEGFADRFFAVPAGLAACFFVRLAAPARAGFLARFVAFADPVWVRFDVPGLLFLAPLDAGFLDGFFLGFLLVLPRDGVMPVSCQVCLVSPPGHASGLLYREWGSPVSISILL